MRLKELWGRKEGDRKNQIEAIQMRMREIWGKKEGDRKIE
jgi:hypothetical protein